MRVIGVVDLMAGRAVHAKAGRRDRYEPVRSAGSSFVDAGDARTLAHIYRHLGVTELYAADLDAIQRGLRSQADAHSHPAEGNRPILSTLAALEPLWVDAGVSSASRAREVLDLGAAHVVVGLETLSSYGALEEICAAVGGERVAFSLDLRDGEPIVAGGLEKEGIGARQPSMVAARAAQAGVGAVIVIDLARVGTGTGLDLDLIARVRESAPELTLVAGGGVRGLDDLARLAEAGCDGALVATALHDGRLGAAEVAAAHRFCQGSPTR